MTRGAHIAACRLATVATETGAVVAHQGAHVIPALQQRVGDVATNEAARAGEKDRVGQGQATGACGRAICPRSVSLVARSDSRSDEAVATTAVGS